MKSFLIFIILLTIGFSHVQCQAINFNGNWSYSFKTDISFDLKLKQTGNKITGSHCATMQGGNKTDCSDDDNEMSIQGVFIPDSKTVIVTFKSFYCDNDCRGKATITWINNKTIVWKIIQVPIDEYYIPKQATLTRQ